MEDSSDIQILHICPLPLYSGLEQYALRVALEERARGYRVAFVALKGGELEAHALKENLTVFSVEFNWAKAVWSAAKQYADILAKLPNVEAIHLHSSQDIDRVGLALLRNRLRGISSKAKVIQQNHVWISHSKKDPIHWLTHKTLDEIWCSSEPAKRDIERYLPVAPDKVQIIRYGRDLDIVNQFADRTSARRELGLNENGLALGAIARIDKAKGIWELLNAAIRVIESGVDLDLVIIGGPTLSDPAAIAFAEKVEKSLRALKPETRAKIHMTGNIANAGRLLKAFDLYAQVAYKETFSLALLDAQLAGLPVIGTDSGGTPEVVKLNQTGWLAKPEDIDSLELAIRKALNEKEQWQPFGQTAKARVERDFDMRVVIPEILRRYNLKKGPLLHGLR